MTNKQQEKKMKLLKENYEYDTDFESKMTDEYKNSDYYKKHNFTSEEEIEKHVTEMLDRIWQATRGYWKRKGVDKDRFEVLLRSFFRYTLDPCIFGALIRKDGWEWISSDHAVSKWGKDYGLGPRVTWTFFRHIDSDSPYT